MKLIPALLAILILQNGFSLQRLKACLDALGVDPAEYGGVDLKAFKAAFRGEEPE